MSEPEELRTRITALLERRPDLSLAKIAHLTTLGESTVRNWHSCQKAYGPTTLAAIKRAVDQIESTTPDTAAIRSRHYYAGLTTAQHIAAILDFCWAKSSIGVITGEYGIGKTEAVRAWRRDHAHIATTSLEFKQFSGSSMLSFLDVLARRLNAGTPAARGGEPLMQSIIDHLNRQPQLLICDQCEGVQPKVFQLIRQIWDDCKGVGIVLLGSPLLKERLDKARMADIGALTSRVGIWQPIAGVTREEAYDILQLEGVTNIEADAFDLLWRATGGSMRRLLSASDLLAEKYTGKTVTTRTIDGVAASLWGMPLPRRSA